VRSVSSGTDAVHRSTSRTLGWDSPNFRAISREILHGSSSTAAIMVFSLTGIRKVMSHLHSRVP
jgi:hypothetical protein